MMTGRFRVTAVPSTDKGFRLINESYDDRKDAEEMLRQLFGDDTVLDGCGYRSVVVSLDELVNGEWTNVSSKLVTGLGE